MSPHARGPATKRNGAIPSCHAIPYDYTNFTTAAKVLSIIASTDKPVLMRVGQCTKTAFAGTTPTINIGTTTPAANEFASITPSAAGQGTMSTTLRRLEANTDIYIKTRSVAASKALTI